LNANLHSIFRAVGLAALLLLTTYANAQPRLGLWIVRDQLNSREKIDAFINFAVANQMRDIFVQVRGRGDAYYNSNFVVRSEYLNGIDWDPLEYTLNQAHIHSLKVHAWLNILLLWSADQRPKNENHLLIQHPEWCSVDADGVKDIQRHAADFAKLGTEGIYLSPLVPEVRDYLVDVIRELATKYQLDGIHLDYIRYAKNCYDYNPAGRLMFRSQARIDPILLTISDKSLYKGLELAEIDSLCEAWDNFRRAAISDLVRNIRRIQQDVRPDMLLSAAVKPDPEEARKYFFQDWPEWLKQDWLDFVVLMNYSKDSDQFEKNLKKNDTQLLKEKIWVGIGVYNQNKYDAMTKTMLALNNRFLNIIFFSYDTFQKDPLYFPVVQRAFDITRIHY